MKIKTFYCAIFAFCILALPAAAASLDAPQSGVAAFCFDGDTFKLMDRRVARLAGIDCPEVAHKDKPAQYYSRQAKEALISLVKGKPVILDFPGVNQKDRYGRLLVDVFLPDGRSVNESMIERGAAFFYPHKDLGPEFQERLRNLQAEAIEERRGMWEHLLSLPLASQPYIGNRNSLRFFPADCPEAQAIKPRNRVNFGNLMDAFLAGYAPARVCLFWPNE